MPRRPCPISSSVPVEILLAGALVVAVFSSRAAAEDLATRTLLPRAVSESLAREGFRQITNIRLMGPSLVAHAISRNGLPARLVVDTDSGRILGFRLLDPEPLSPKSP